MQQIQLTGRLLLGHALLLSVVSEAAVATAAPLLQFPMAPAQYQLTAIDIPDQVFMVPFQIANNGTVCGLYYDKESRIHGFLWRDGIITTLDAPGWRHTQPTGLNDHGQVVGVLDNQQFVGPATGTKVFVYSTQQDTWTLLPDIPGQLIANNTSINNKGIVYGASSEGTEDAQFNSVAWTWDGKVYDLFRPPGANPAGFTAATGLNDHGQLAGFYLDNNWSLRAFVGNVGNSSSITPFDIPGADGSQVFLINNRGDMICGYWKTDQYTSVLIQNGQIFQVPVPEGSSVFGMNDRGQLVGLYPDATGVWHGFIATPFGQSKP